MRILLVEDNPKVAQGLQTMLLRESIEADVTHAGFEAEELASTKQYAVILLDLMLPDRDGMDVCRALRRRGVTTPILMLTALADTANRVEGLNAGADDYLPKPFEFTELCARIRALSRRRDQQETSFLEYGGLRLDLIKRQATREELVVPLSAKEFSLLELFIRNPEKVLPRSTIGEKVWDMNFEPSSNVVDVYISALRKKIDRGFEQPLIHTVVGTGYRFGMPT